MNDIEIGAASVGITEVAKNLGLSRKYCSIFAIFIAVVLAVLSEIAYGKHPIGFLEYVTTFFFTTIRGIIIGTSATGLYSMGGKVINKTTKKNANSKLETH